MNTMTGHFLTLADLSEAEIHACLDRALRLKEATLAGKRIKPLEGKMLGLVFEKPSLRTRVTFEVGMRQLGGDSIYLSAQEVQLGVRESVADVARNLERYVDGIVLRTFRHEVAEELARYSSIPVINGLTDRLHPCQVFSDLLTLLEKKGRLGGLRIAYIGDGNNLANSWLLGAAIVGMELTVACPKGYEPDRGVLREAKKRAKETGAKVSITHLPERAARDADVIYTDVWTSMGKEKEGARRRVAFSDFQVNGALVASASKDVLVMHCLPAHRGEEITDEVIDGPHSIVFDQAENRLHAQKALLEALLGGRSRDRSRSRKSAKPSTRGKR
jgi:ornithine carbamoyltransferase